MKIDKFDQKIKNNDWFDTAHQLLGACNPGVDFNEYTLADDHLNYKNIGAGDGFVKEGYGTLLAHYRKGVPVKLNTLVIDILMYGNFLPKLSWRTCIII